METLSRQEARIDFRCKQEEKSLIEEAAMLSGMTVSSFIKAKLLSSAREVIRSHQVTQLSEQDQEVFLALLEEDVSPVPALVQAAESYRARCENK